MLWIFIFALIAFNVAAIVLARAMRGNRINVGKQLILYQGLLLASVIMLLPFYWMIATAFKDARTARAIPPVWLPMKEQAYAPVTPGSDERIAVRELETARRTGQEIRVAPEEAMAFREVERDGVTITVEAPDIDAVFTINPEFLTYQSELTFNPVNFVRAWYRPEETSRGEVNFLTYFVVSLVTSLLATAGTLVTATFAAFAFARLEFWGKEVLFYVVLATMMVPGQVLLIPNFLILSGLNMLDTYTALVLPWIASVFTIFLMRQFFMTIPVDLWDAARIDGASRFRYLWQVVVPLSKPVFVTAGIFDFLNNWNSLLWPLIVTSSPSKRTLMVGLQNLNSDAGTEYHILMAASCFAILPIVIVFFFMQRFFVEGIARTGLK